MHLTWLYLLLPFFNVTNGLVSRSNTLSNTELCQTDGPAVRLVGGRTNTEGRVEVCRGSVWRSVRYCGQTTAEANVICKQLGYPLTGIITLNTAELIIKTIYIYCW